MRILRLSFVVLALALSIVAILLPSVGANDSEGMGVAFAQQIAYETMAAVARDRWHCSVDWEGWNYCAELYSWNFAQDSAAREDFRHYYELGLSSYSGTYWTTNVWSACLQNATTFPWYAIYPTTDWEMNNACVIEAVEDEELLAY